jgi:hypothetical protein
MSKSIINRDKKTLSYKEYLLEKYRPLVLITREMEKTIGKTKTHEIVEKTFYDNIVNWVAEELEKFGPVNEFADFVRIEKEDNESIEIRNKVTIGYVKDTESELGLHITECLYAEVFKELEAEDIGYLVVCNPDHAYASACNPCVKLRRSKTLMQGDEYCDHVWYWDTSEKPKSH